MSECAHCGKEIDEVESIICPYCMYESCVFCSLLFECSSCGETICTHCAYSDRCEDCAEEDGYE